MKKLLLCTSMIILLISATCIAQINKSSDYKPVDNFDPSRDAQKDIDNAIVEATKSNRRILLDVGGNWCIWCKRLDTLFMKNQDLQNFMHNNYVVVKINFSKENENQKVLSQYPEIKGYPHMFVLEKDGKLIHSQDTGELELGKGYSREKVFAFLKKWAPNQSRSENEFEMNEGDSNYTMKKYFFCLLKKGPNRNQDSLATLQIQNGHLAHISRLAKEGKIAIAGPFDGDDDYRGIIIFNVETKEEAERLEKEDPAIKSGRLIMEIYPLWAAKGSKLP